ncbi:MAG: hypothetical protein N838_03300 [Thiohalocapsa sp. PB-PSB1]|jgi:hypothetical protein|nr:MAG: hypothetical protein N838_03300 [Thiohalocapsa sp. PB-PSB1]
MKAIRLITWFIILLSIGLLSQTAAAANVRIGSPEDSNCGDVKNFLAAIPFTQAGSSPQEVIERLATVVDPIHFSRYCTQGACRYEDSFAEFASQLSLESLLISSWSFSNVREFYGANWAKATFRLRITNVCGDDSGNFAADFLFYCNGEGDKFTEVHTIRDESRFNDFLMATEICAMDVLY